MTTLRFVTFGEEHFGLYRKWSFHKAIHPWIGDPIQEWFDYVMNTPTCFTWMIYEGDTPVAHLEVAMLEDDHSHAQVVIIITPEKHRNGYGRRILKLMLSRQELADVTCFYAFIHRNNVASIGLFSAMGYKPTSSEPDEEGYLRYELKR